MTKSQEERKQKARERFLERLGELQCGLRDAARLVELGSARLVREASSKYDAELTAIDAEEG